MLGDYQIPVTHSLMKRLGKQQRTPRGFKLVRFKDCNETPCSLQASSLAIYVQPGTSAVWLGVDDPHPQVMWSDALRLGIETTQQDGWVPYPLPPQVSLSTRIHLTRKQVKALIGHLQAWLDTDSFVVE